MKPTPKIPRIFKDPGYVGAFQFAGLVCVVAGLGFLLIAVKADVAPWGSVGWIVAGFVQFLYADIARDVARAAWQSELTASDLAPALQELALQAQDRAQREHAADLQRDEEIHRALAARDALSSDSP